MADEIPDDWWTNGLCSTFAARLQQRFGGQIWAVVNHSRKYPAPQDDTLYHCYCVIDGTAYDAEGAHTLAEASDTSEARWGPVPEMDRDNDVVIQWRRVNTRWLAQAHGDYSPDDFPAVDEYISRHPQLFAGLVRKT